MKRDKKLAKEAVGVAWDAVGVANEIFEQSTETTDRVIGLAHEAVVTASGAVALVSVLSEKLETLRGEALSADELRNFAEVVPQWKVTSGISQGQAVKFYERTIQASELIPERRPGGEQEFDTYKSLADAGTSDMKLATIFGSYYVNGDYINGDHYIIRIYSDEVGPVTYQDLDRVLNAEQYLVDAGYIQPTAEAVSPA